MKRYKYMLLLLLVALLGACSQDEISVVYDPEDAVIIPGDGHASDGDSEKWVDLGLSVPWASCNIGAQYPEESGDYFAWGEIETKKEYTKENSLTYNKSLSDISGDVSYDAATANWGAPARMPTRAEFQELIDNTVIQWTTRNWVKGYKVISIKNGKSIFFPAVGYRNGTIDRCSDELYYWSSTSIDDENFSAYSFYLDSDEFHCGDFFLGNSDRYLGLSVRPVLGGGKGRPNAITGTVITVSETIVEVSCTFTNVPEGAICGIEYKDNNGNVNEQVVVCTSSGVQTITLQNLTPCTAYSFRGIIRWDGQTIYGEYKEFTTLESVDPNLWMDLGLSVLWAVHNVGANTPEEFGDYFAWGEIVPKKKYSEDNYLIYDMSLSDFSGDARYDAATANWGVSARIPTMSEFQELVDNSTSQWTTYNGVKGRLVTSIKNGKSIFLPAAGYWNGASLDDTGENGKYWSSTLFATVNSRAGGLFLHNSYNEYLSTGWALRYYGFPVRPVRKK